MVLLEAIHELHSHRCTLWNAATWSTEAQSQTLTLFHSSTPSHPIHLPHDDAAFTDDPQVMFSSMDTVDLLEAAVGDTPPLLLSLRTCPLPSSYSSSQALPPSSSDAVPASSVLT